MSLVVDDAETMGIQSIIPLLLRQLPEPIDGRDVFDSDKITENRPGKGCMVLLQVSPEKQALISRQALRSFQRIQQGKLGAHDHEIASVIRDLLRVTGKEGAERHFLLLQESIIAPEDNPVSLRKDNGLCEILGIDDQVGIHRKILERHRHGMIPSENISPLAFHTDGLRDHLPIEIIE